MTGASSRAPSAGPVARLCWPLRHSHGNNNFHASFVISDGEPLGQDRFGLDDNNRVNDSFGLHLLTHSGQWVLWNAANAPGTRTFGGNPPFYDEVKRYSAFRTDDQ